MKTKVVIVHLINVLLLLGMLGFLFQYYRAPLTNVYSQLQRRYFPCAVPITYSINRFDKQFGISEQDLITATEKAEALWEKPVGKTLFSHTIDGQLKLNLIYDVRQDTTVQLAKLGITVKNDLATYDQIRSRYESLIAKHAEEKKNIDTLIASYGSQSDAYTKEVDMWNIRGGAPKSAYDRLIEEQNTLHEKAQEITRRMSAYNAAADDINALVSTLNGLSETLHVETAHYNAVGASHGEFTEGEYESGPEGTSINIYQFENKEKLVRVLAHELGHALGLQHVEDTKAIMYRLNSGINEKLTDTDLVAVKRLCGVK